MTFQKGQSGNPAGRPSGRQAFIDRASTYLEDYTINDLIELAQDKHRFGKLSVIDGMIVRRIAASLSKGGGHDMDRLLDRIIGKATNTVEVAPKDSYAALVAAAGALDKQPPHSVADIGDTHEQFYHPSRQT